MEVRLSRTSINCAPGSPGQVREGCDTITMEAGPQRWGRTRSPRPTVDENPSAPAAAMAVVPVAPMSTVAGLRDDHGD